MASMRDIRTRIKSVKETMQITKAMNLISSAKLKKARRQLNDTLPYFEKIQATLVDILHHSQGMEHRYLKQVKKGEPKKVGYFVITADKGLCGAYNHNVIKLAEATMQDVEHKHLFVVGNMGREYFARKKFPIDVEFLYTAQSPTLHRTREIARTMLSLFEQGELDEIYVVYTKMISSLRLEPQVLKILPLDKNIIEDKKNTENKYHEFMSYDPSAERVLDVVAPIFVKGVIYGAMVESYSSEQSARMTAMDAATKSAKDMIKDLTLLYNRARQASITQEISEIVGGANALKG
ncbi:MAG: ATP synthase F1 subunit gamma [Hyphomonadaceae bacterium]|nr:ATP synthase F1 subunit gamma [Clostridia bacterium]